MPKSVAPKNVMSGWRIWHPNGTYYAGPTGIGPRFGASRGGAMVFETAAEAVRQMTHFAFAMCRIELPDGRMQSEVPNAGQGESPSQ